MTKKKKSPKQQAPEEIRMTNTDIKMITGVKLNIYLRK